MNKFFKGAICAGLCLTMLAAAGCKKPKLDNETRQLQLATGALDGNFNPFFYTSQNDGNMVAMTQISMLTVNEDGNLVCGDDWPTVVKSFTKTYYDSKAAGQGNVIPEGVSEGRTEYEFVIKNGIKFSDGQPLTIKDVLFNMYVYLDPAYTGSSTMYSTDIQGLKAYRTQVPAADASTDVEKNFLSDAQGRIETLIYWSLDNALSNETVPSDPKLKKDYDTVVKLFREEAESDWTSVYTGWEESYKDTHRFTAGWQAYLFNEGIVKLQTVDNPVTGGQDNPKDENEKYYTTLDNDYETGDTPKAQGHIDAIAQATTQAKINEFLAREGNSGLSAEYAKEQLEKEYCVDVVVQAYTVKSRIYEIVSAWATAETALEAFAGEARADYFKDIRDKNQGELLVKTISGVTTAKTTISGVEYDTLKIVVNGVDPKAIYNFSFTVAPMHYYSGTYKGVDYTDAEHANGVDEFGVDAGNKDFYDTVLRDVDKNGLPKGAGAYKATSNSGSSNPSRGQFFYDNIVYFARNDYFETVGANIQNAKIKLVNYKVMGTDKILTALQKGEIDYGNPDATSDNQKLISLQKSLTSVSYATGGYGYVGINPKFVPEYKVRQAIMKAMDTNTTVAYFGTSLADTIYRPMSTTSWAYPKDADGNLMSGVKNADKYEYPSIAYTTDNNEIRQLVEDAGYVLENGKYVKRNNSAPNMKHAALGTKLKFTFTIAGETTKHPAWKMFTDARDTLNKIGFDITVSTDIQALKKMTTGNLAVWAAAWSSAVDPDMYQVYHMDSRATNVLNWNYRNILNDTSAWSYEYSKIYTLSGLIDDARRIDATDVNAARDARSAIYADCLDLVMDLAVELPTYQRKDLCVYNNTVIKSSSLVKKPSYNMGLFDKIWEIEYV